MKTFRLSRTWITLILALSIILQPVHRARSNQYACGAPCVWGALVLIVGGLICYGLVKICKQCLPPPADKTPDHPPTPCNTNAPVHHLLFSSSGLSMPIGTTNDLNWDQSVGMEQYDISGFGWTDPQGNLYRTYIQGEIQTSIDLIHWNTDCAIKGYISWPSGILGPNSNPINALFVCYTNGVPYLTNYDLASDGRMSAPAGLIDAMAAPRKFFRLVP